MTDTPTDSIIDADAAALFAELDARPVINAAGAYTVLGGSKLSEGVRRAMEESNRHFADMRSLMQSAGRAIAGLLDCESALVTSGAASALALGAAAMLTKGHPERLERLPDTAGFPHEIITQRLTRQKYDRCVEFCGARLVEYGDANGTTLEQLRAAITPETVALHYYVPPHPLPALLPLETAIAEAHERGLPVIVDAAGHTYPVDEMRMYTRMGADLVTYANKYFDAPHSTGLLVGRADLVDEAQTNSFLGFESSGYLTFGRAMKVDRQEIFATVAALQEWLAMDHESRLLLYGERCDRVLGALREVGAVRAHRISERETPLPVIRDGVRMSFESESSALAVYEALRDGEPSIWTHVNDKDRRAIDISVAFCTDDELSLLIRRLSLLLDPLDAR